MKKLFLVLALCFTLNSIVRADDLEDFSNEVRIEKIVFKTSQSTVSIVGLGGGGVNRCSGTLYKNEPDKTIVLTAKHCTAPTEELYVENVLVIDTGVSQNDDIAYLVLEHPIVDKTPIKIAEKESKIHDIVFIIGYPNGDPYIRLGAITLITNDWQYMRMSVIPGCSGGGVYNYNGELTGILWGGFMTEPTAIFEPLSDIKRFIKQKNL